MLNPFQSVAPRGNLIRPSKPPKRLPRPRPEQYPVIGKPKIELGTHGAPTMQISKWHAGDAPHVGWWFTKVTNDGDTSLQAWRWWDGSYWSLSVRSEAPARLAARDASMPSWRDNIQWCRDWPEGARVQRVNPLTGEVTGG